MVKKHSNGGTVPPMHMVQQPQKVAFDTNGGSSNYMNADYGSQAYTQFNGHMGNHVVEGQFAATQNVILMFFNLLTKI